MNDLPARQSRDKGVASLSVVIASDFEPTAAKSWNDEIKLMQALAAQTLAPAFEVILVESSQHRDEPVPSAIRESGLDVRLEFFDAEDSATLKDYGVALATGDWIAVVEADCVPAPDWLELLIDAAVAHPQTDAISGRTNYGEETSYKRVLNLLDRSLNDTGRSKECAFVSNNGALYRASMLRNFPFPKAITPFLSAQLRNRNMKAHGHRFYFERAAVMRHAVGGLSFIRDYRMNMGHMQMSVDAERSGRRIPLLLANNLKDDVMRLRWRGRSYLRWWDWGLAVILVLWVRVPEAVGMYHALRDVPVLRNSAYR